MLQIKNVSLSILILAICALGIIGILRIDITENLDAAIPGGAQFDKLSPWLEANKKAFVFAIDISDLEDLDEAEERGNAFISLVREEAPDAFSSLNYQSDIDPEELADFLYHNIYLYLDSADYKTIDGRISEEAIHQKVKDSKSKLLSPEGLGLKPWLVKDPLGFMGLVLNNINSEAFGEAKANGRGLYLSSDQSRLFIKGEITHNPAISEENAKLRTLLSEIEKEWKAPLEYFGVVLISDANSQQIKKDIRLTIGLALALIVGLLFFYYRKGIILLLFLVPGIFGVLFAIGLIYLYQGHISGLALAAGTIIFGIVADYSFHFFSQFKSNRDALVTRKDILLPLGMSSLTTIVAFLSLIFAESKVLQDFGMFTSLSLLGTVLFVLGVLPQLLRIVESKLEIEEHNAIDSFFDKVRIQDRKTPYWKLVVFFILTGIFFYSALNIQFEEDLSKLHFYPEALKQNERSLQDIDPDTQRRLNILISDSNLDTSIDRNYNLDQEVQKLRSQGRVHSSFGLGTVLVPERIKQEKLANWNRYWKDKKSTTLDYIQKAAKENGFSNKAFSQFYNLIELQPSEGSQEHFLEDSEILNQLLIQKDGQYNLLTTIVCNKHDLDSIKSQLSIIPGITFLDGQSIVSNLIDAVKRDFNFLLLFASVLVFLAMLIMYGSIELTLISFVPMVVSWIWILGIAAFLDIKFNFINIILATFIFGLGDDFSIFITDGLQKKYKYGTRILKHYKSGIILSSISTIIGTGILIFASHPALKSIALVSVLGILAIVFVSFFLQPFLFRFFISARTEEGKPPRSLYRVISSILGFSIFISGSLICVLISFMVRIIPFMSIKRKKKISHWIIQKASAIQMELLPMVRKRYNGLELLDFSTPSIIIANHSSFFDVLMILRLNPNIVILVKEWVYYSPLFGPLVRFADYVPSFESMEDNFEKLEELKEKGYSLLVFPEGKRSINGKIKRFRKGAFLLSSKLKMDITPIMLHGIHYAMSKYEYTIKNSFAEVAVLPRIKYDDMRFGSNVRERTKKISAYFKTEFKRYNDRPEMVNHVFDPLLNVYRYKGPILEWYFRIKWRFEKYNYELYNQIIGPGKKKIYDLGCGYSYVTYFLYLRDENRSVYGCDYDDEKIAVANHAYLKNENQTFVALNIVNINVEDADAVLLADVLHYLSSDDQIRVLANAKNGLKNDGVIIIRDGISDTTEEHEWTKKSEKWSTKIIGFNKTTTSLNFLKEGFLESWAANNGFDCKLESASKKSSNRIFTLRPVKG